MSFDLIPLLDLPELKQVDQVLSSYWRSHRQLKLSAESLSLLRIISYLPDPAVLRTQAPRPPSKRGSDPSSRPSRKRKWLPSQRSWAGRSRSTTRLPFRSFVLRLVSSAMFSRSGCTTTSTRSGRKVLLHSLRSSFHLLHHHPFPSEHAKPSNKSRDCPIFFHSLDLVNPRFNSETCHRGS